MSPRHRSKCSPSFVEFSTNVTLIDQHVSARVRDHSAGNDPSAVVPRAPASRDDMPECIPTIRDDVRGLTRAISAGDRGAFAELYSAWFDRSLAIARAVTGRDESFCLDVVQDAMIRAARSIPVMDSPRALSAWMARVIRTSAVDHLRRESRRRRREATVLSRDRDTARTSDIGPAERWHDKSARLEWLRVQLAGLDDRDVDLIIQRFAHDRTLEQLAMTLNETGTRPDGDRLLSAGAVHGRLRRAFARLAKAAPAERANGPPMPPNNTDSADRPAPPTSHNARHRKL